jgi:hypothetical protein
LLADALAIGMADLGVWIVHVSPALAPRKFIDVHPQEPLLADFPFDINDF